ncbi:hypothetical protein RQP46_002223 [Phenoliferia psychrophenolica]
MKLRTLHRLGAPLSTHARPLLSPSHTLLSSLAKRPSLLATFPTHRNFSSSLRTAGWIPDVSGWIPAVPSMPSVPSISGWVPSIIRGTPTPPPTPEPEPIEPEPVVAVEPPVDLASTVDPVAATADPAHHFLTTSSDVLINTGTLDLTSLAGSWGIHPIMRIESLLLQLHESFPFLGYTPWYILIPTFTIILRLALFPFSVRAQQNAARMARIQPQMLAGMAKVKDAKASGDVMREQMATMEVQTLMKRENVHPIKNIIFPLVQGAAFMTTFFSLRALSSAGIPSFHTEGAGWFVDLAAADPYWVLPIASTALTMATLELGVDSTTQVQTSTTKNMKLFFRAALVMSFPFIAYFPAGILMYWTTNNFLSLLQAFILRQPSIRTALSIPLLPKKALEGEPGYVPEPSFSESFKALQTGMQDKWDETKDKADRQREAKEATLRDVAPAEVYVPRAPLRKRVGAVENYASGLTENVGGGAGEIEAKPLSRKEEEKAQRVLKARMRRK